MKLKCIGGAVNGHCFEVGDQLNYVARKHVANPVAAVAGPFSDPMLRTTEHYYTRRQINTPDGKVYFLAPHDWSDHQALQFALC